MQAFVTLTEKQKSVKKLISHTALDNDTHITTLHQSNTQMAMAVKSNVSFMQQFSFLYCVCDIRTDMIFYDDNKRVWDYNIF